MFSTEQESFWRGSFGDDYAERCKGADWIATNTALFARILRATIGLKSVLELGANVGLNIHALRTLLPTGEMSAVEINPKAAAALRGISGLDVHEGSLLEFTPARTWDLVFTKGVLIHLSPDVLPQVYDLMWRCSARYMVVAEYYNPSPIEVNYRGHAGRLYKRDFAGELLDRHKRLRLVDYGFCYRRDPVFPQDDITWFLLEKVD